MQVKLITSYHSHAILKGSFKLHLKLLYHVASASKKKLTVLNQVTASTFTLGELCSGTL